MLGFGGSGWVGNGSRVGLFSWRGCREGGEHRESCRKNLLAQGSVISHPGVGRHPSRAGGPEEREPGDISFEHSAVLAPAAGTAPVCSTLGTSHPAGAVPRKALSPNPVPTSRASHAPPCALPWEQLIRYTGTSF